MKNNVLHIAESFEGGGAETVFRETVLMLRAQLQDNYNHIVTCIESDKFVSEIDFPIRKNSYGKIRTTLSQIYSFKNYSSVFKTLLETQPSIIHVQNYGNLSPSVLRAILKYKSNRRNRVKVIHTVHTFEYICSHHAAFDYRRNRACTDCANNVFKYKIFYRRCSRLGYLHSIGKGITSLIANYWIEKGVFDYWISPSEFLRSFMVESRLDPFKVSVIRNPLMEKAVTAEFGKYNSKRFKFVYFGRFSEEKNLDCLIRAFAILVLQREDVSLTLIGRGEEELNLIRLIEKLQIGSFVKVEGFLPKAELEVKLKTFHFSVVPSKCYETACLAIVEAVNNGLFPLVTNHGGMKETVELIQCGLTFENNNVNDLALKMNELIRDHENGKNRVRAAKEIINKVYNETDYVHHIRNIYENI